MAVITEIEEKMISRSMIWMRTPAKEEAVRSEVWPSFPSSLSWISRVLLVNRKRPPTMSMISLPEMPWPKTVKKAWSAS